MAWIWQDPNWPEFGWSRDKLVSPISELDHKRGQVSALVRLDAHARQSSLDVLLENIIASSAIEGETLDRASVRSSLANKLGLIQTDQSPGLITDKANGVANLVLDAISNTDQELSKDRLFTWHRWLFPENEFRLEKIDVGKYRPTGQMQVVSGRADRPTVHFEAPPAEQVSAEMDRFISWFNASAQDHTISPFERAALAHLWFVTIHPFDDGNGRIARAISDLALAQGDPQTVTAFSMSSAILQDRKGYYEALERCQSGSVSVDDWMHWFIGRIDHAMSVAMNRTQRTLDKARFWDRFRDADLLPEQKKALNKLLDGVFPDGLSAKKYMAFTGVSKPTATRHLADLVKQGCLEKSDAGGRSTAYKIVPFATDSGGVQLSVGQTPTASTMPKEQIEDWQHAEYRLINTQLAIAEREILDDIATGDVADSVASFEELHAYVDANMYVGDADRALSPIENYCADHGYAVQGRMRIASEIADTLDRWLKNGRSGSARDYHLAPDPAQFFLCVEKNAYPVADFEEASRMHLAVLGASCTNGPERPVWIETPKGDRIGQLTSSGQVVDRSGGSIRILYQPGTPEPLRVQEGSGERESVVASLKAYPLEYLRQWHAVTADDIAGQKSGQSGRKGILYRETNLGLQVLAQELGLRGHNVANRNASASSTPSPVRARSRAIH